MGVQARAAVTRQRIIDVAVDLFAENGYTTVGLKTIVDAANITTGAFYYHFESKEAVAMAIIGQGWPRLWSVVEQYSGSSPQGMETVIAASFAISDVMKRDRTVALGQHFNLAFSQLSDEFRRESGRRAGVFIQTIGAMIPATDIRDDTTPEEVGAQVWINVNGCHLLSDRMEDSVVMRMASSWRTLVRGTVPAEAVAGLEQFVVRTAALYE